jgi:halimadienyl-diphosphate synthase
MYDSKREEARRLLYQPVRIAASTTAYDTAWTARVPDAHLPSLPAFPEALEWLRNHQRLDGSWGGQIEYYHDRVISTLVAITTLARDGGRRRNAAMIQKGETYLRRSIRQLHYDPYETVGFELIFPTLWREAQQLGLDLPYAAGEKYDRLRKEKLRLISPHVLYSREVTVAHSLEFLGDSLDVERARDAQEMNGSFGNSPSATAYFLTRRPDDPAARRYLTEVMATNGGAAVPLHPVEIFNRSWVLYNLDLAGLLDDLRDEVRHCFDSFYQAWDDERGLGFSRQYSVPDLDDTAVVFKLLRKRGYDLDPMVFTAYEREDHLACFPYERNPSIGVHVHLLDTLRTCPDWEHRPRMVDKILGFLRRTRVNDAYWFDKWHVSSYYATAHAVIALIGFDDEMARSAVAWIVSSQRPDGSWGCIRPTVEETAYCLQALSAYYRHMGSPNRTVLSRAAQYLYEHHEPGHYPPMWIDKCLYTPSQIVHSAVVSALGMYGNL